MKHVCSQTCRRWLAPRVRGQRVVLVDEGLREAIGEVARTANWFPELTDHLKEMVACGNLDAIGDWAASDVWQLVAQEGCRCEEVCDACDAYVADVRQALFRLVGLLERRAAMLWVGTDPQAVRDDVRRLGLDGAVRYNVRLARSCSDPVWAGLTCAGMREAIASLQEVGDDD